VERQTPSIVTRPFVFLSRWRSLPLYEIISYFFMYASIPMLAYGIQSYDFEIIKLIVFVIITLYSGFFAALIWNDITDADIDAIAHNDRPIPSGIISRKKFFVVALFFSALTFIFAFLISIWCLFIVGASALFVTFHNKYLKKSVKLPAYSEIFTPLQWIVVPLFGFMAIWTVLPQSSEIYTSFLFFGNISTSYSAIQQMIVFLIFTYFADNAHDLPEGIHDIEGDRKLGVKTYANSFGEKNAAIISITMFSISGILGLLLYFISVLSEIFLILFIFLWLHTFRYYYKLIKANQKEMKEFGKIVGRKGFDYFLFCFLFIFIDILIQLLVFNFQII